MDKIFLTRHTVQHYPDLRMVRIEEIGGPYGILVSRVPSFAWQPGAGWVLTAHCGDAPIGTIIESFYSYRACVATLAAVTTSRTGVEPRLVDLVTLSSLNRESVIAQLKEEQSARATVNTHERERVITLDDTIAPPAETAATPVTHPDRGLPLMSYEEWRYQTDNAPLAAGGAPIRYPLSWPSPDAPRREGTAATNQSNRAASRSTTPPPATAAAQITRAARALDHAMTNQVAAEMAQAARVLHAADSEEPIRVGRPSTRSSTVEELTARLNGLSMTQQHVNHLHDAMQRQQDIFDGNMLGGLIGRASDNSATPAAPADRDRPQP